MNIFRKGILFFGTGIYELKPESHPTIAAFFLRYLRVVVLAVHGFFKDNCSTRASALTYYSLLSIVPVLAMAFGIAKGFNLDQVIQNQLLQLSDSGSLPEPVIRNIIDFSQTLLKKTKGGIIAGIGFIMLFWSVLSIMQKIEESFNNIWEIAKARTFFRRITDYLALLVFTPIFVVISASVSVVVATQAGLILRSLGTLGGIAPYLLFVLKIIPYLSIWTMLIIFYLIMPNTRVPTRSAILAGVFTGTIYQAVQYIFIKFQVGVSGYGAIYGGFAALPLFLIWIQTSWSIVLFGAEIAVAHENHKTFGFHPDYSMLSVASRRILVLRILHFMVGSFIIREGPMNARRISEELEIPIRLVRQLLGRLIETGLAVETVHRIHHEPLYQVGMATESLSAQTVMEAFDQLGGNPKTPAQSRDTMKAVYDDLTVALSRAPENRLLKDV